MKKIFTLILSAFIILVSCDDALNVVSKNDQTYSNSFKNEQDLNAVMIQIHRFINMYYADQNPFLTVGFIVDETDYSDGLKNWNPKPVIDHPGIGWKGFYDIIFQSNLLLDNVHRVTKISEERKNFYVGQAHFAKGLAYFELARRWGDCIITKNSIAISPYANSSAVTVLEEAVSSSQKAFELLSNFEKLKNVSGAAITAKQYGSKGACAALLAHIWAWKGSMIDLYGYTGNSKECYTQSVSWSNKIIKKEVGDYELLSTSEELCNYMSDPAKLNPEAIFDITFDRHASTNSITACPGKYLITWPVNKLQNSGDIVNIEFRTYNSTIEKLYSDPEDQRRKAYFYNFDELKDENGDKGFAYIYKWRNGIYQTDAWEASGQRFQSLNANYNYWRLADIYLLRAECNLKLGNSAIATEDLNTIRNRAGAQSYPSLGESDLKYAIFAERQKELFGEGHRYYDIVRNNYIKEELQGNFKKLTIDDIKQGALYLPIGEDAFKLNDVIRQNIYWSKYL
ncbi:MAG: RagB/SusD family nutrient uptake outer membrane protein [Bacteroidia bacterium]|nr:RagB/SusD family nutrient uptake outer membrane protein [Bacteroidia bacterium]